MGYLDHNKFSALGDHDGVYCGSTEDAKVLHEYFLNADIHITRRLKNFEANVTYYPSRGSNSHGKCTAANSKYSKVVDLTSLLTLELLFHF